MARQHAFIFDLDGTLIDSLDDITGAVNHALVAENRQMARRDQVRAWVGDGLPALCRRAWPDADDAALETFIKKASDYYRGHCLDATRAFPNMLKTLDLLQESGHPMCVLSNKPHAFTIQTIDGLGLSRFFVEMRGCTSEADKKPSPIGALALAKAMGRLPSEVFMVGDSIVDIETARNAGMRGVAVTWGFRDRKELVAASPDFIVDSPAELLFL